ncbi:MAG TPA: alkaline phosphatase family protein [Candidatus Binataceae bacterium]|nr:alkaline phosphatase family protein [Candidatus Binataceae bacterium]
MSILSPANGAAVFGTVSIATQASPPVSWVNLYVDGKYIASSPPYTFSWNSATVTNGSHTIRVDGKNSTGTIATTSIAVSVENTVSITAPQNGATLWGIVNVTTSTTSAVQSLNLYVDGALLASGAPSTYSWNTTTLPDGTHTLTANGYDSGQNQIGTSSISVSTANDATAFPTTTPIKHLLVIFAENHSFDNLFATYQPPSGQTVRNLLSQGIITSSNAPGPNFALAAQQQANDTDVYSINPTRTGPYGALPQPNTTYAFGQPQYVNDNRFPSDLANGPYRISAYVAPDQPVGDPVHRFYQMWQQVAQNAMDLFVWVAQTVGNGIQSSPAPSPSGTYQGALSMGYYDINADAPHLLFMAQNYALADNYHQAVMGGTNPEFFYLTHADVLFYNDSSGTPTVPPSNLIDIPDPQAGTNNFYAQDGNSGGSYVNCSDTTQPGVAAIMNYLNSLPYPPFNGGDCAPNTYYLLNNVPVGTSAPVGRSPTITQRLTANKISWKLYGTNWGGPNASQIITDVSNNWLPAVAYLAPETSNSGHPAQSTLTAFETFTTGVVNAIINNPTLFSSTAILITMDESGGYFDIGYIQPIDFFGDGPRVPAVIISPYAKAGYVDHTYYDHASVLKFIEANWGLPRLSSRTRDNLPNPQASSDPYVPANRPAVGDLMNMFDFTRFRSDAPSIR